MYKMFPNEIYEIILGFIDEPRVLLGLQQVCKDWHTIISRILTKSNKWRRCCRAEIDDECLRKLVEQLSPSFVYKPNCPVLKDERLEPDFWKRVYRSWINWERCLKVSPKVDCMSLDKLKADTNDESIAVSCIAVWDDVIGIGLSERMVHFRKIHYLDKPFFRCHSNGAYEIKFWSISRRLIAIIQDRNMIWKFWDLSKKIQLTNTEIFAAPHVYINQNRCYSLKDNVITISKLNALNVEKVSEIALSFEPDIFSYTSLYGLYVDEYNIKVIIIPTASDESAILKYNAQLKFDSNGNELMIANENIHNNTYSSECYRYMSSSFVLSSNVVFIRLLVNKFAFAVNDEPCILYENLGYYLGGTIVTVIFHANLMIFGLKEGIICIFRVNNIEDLLHLDFDTLVTKRISLNDEIVDLKISYSRNIPTVIVRGKEFLHIVKF